MPRIGSVIRTLREQRAMTQADLADLAGIGQSFLSRAETSGRGDRISAAVLERIARALGVTPEEILLQAGVRPSEDRTEDIRWRQLERVFRSLPPDRQAELLAIAHTLSSLSVSIETAAALTVAPRVIGEAGADSEKGAD